MRAGGICQRRPSSCSGFDGSFRTERRSARIARNAIADKIGGILLAIEDANYNPSLTRRLSEFEARKSDLEISLRAEPEPVVRLHPNLAEVFRDKVVRGRPQRTGHSGRGRRGLSVADHSRIVLTPRPAPA